MRPVLQLFDWIGVQSQEDMGRFAIAGFPQERLHLMGSMKYDVAALVADHPGKGVEERDEGWGESKQDSEERDGGVGGRDGGRLEGLGMQEGGIGESVGREGRVDGGWGGG